MFLVFNALLTCVLVVCLTCSQPFVFGFLWFIAFPTSDGSSIDDYSEHNMWNPILELLFLKHVNGIVDPYLVDLDLAKIAFSCHFALDVLCYKEEVFVSTR